MGCLWRFSPPLREGMESGEVAPSPSRRRSTTTRSTSVRSSWPSRPARSPPLWRSGLFFASSSLFLILVINTLLAVSVRRYLQELQDVTSRLELSDTPQPIQIASSSELYPIVSLINDLIAQVGSALKDREKYQSLLEETIDQRRRRLLDNIRRIEELQRSSKRPRRSSSSRRSRR